MNWNHISERLPELFRDVLFVCYFSDTQSFSEIGFGYYEGDKTRGDAIVMATYSGDGDWSPCTHWMELPTLPEVSE